MAILDYIFYRQTLNRYHIIGVLSLVVCALLITIAGQVEGEQPVTTPFSYSTTSPDEEGQVIKKALIPSWIPVVIGIILPIMFAFQGILVKFLTSPSVEFDASTLTFSSCSIVCFLNLIAAVGWYWRTQEKFDMYLFVVGSIGSILDTAGIVSI
mmetsp:Transcript_19422/g.29842  ORF Transcript_19422/g.29842 Transcript_19422/m.29842 type:complete len:154 (+) Transcript_19422:499-960(+)